MPYESEIIFTLDTICPWTYLALRRLRRALDQYRTAHPDSPATFKIKYSPYQLYPEATKEGEDKYEWYKKSRYGDSEEKMKMYTTLMKAYGVSCGIEFKFGGTVANTLDAHRVIQHWQEERGSETVDRIVDSLYSQYFENEKHPSSESTLLEATTAAGIPESEAKTFIEDEYEGLQEVKMMIRENAGNGIDAVPYIVFEGKRRDITLQGAKEVEEYVKALEQVAKESG
ncbi:thioredoxin-like protein [Saccharata proteae CBS 121410]|uniref:Thioredoxin-like protein n=1 Tax=Saccharata proteae CBS 121410 TaxID=1314787 RepID=A0A9P4LX66_9PEZI|nr:thioredoxin-like protein [Saccharata proteae CBS 121410]